MSAVRSSPTLLEMDIRHALGFITSPKRLNVSLTRARALLIILGNPHVLAKDPCWREVLEYCVKRGGYIGCDLPTAYSSLTLDDSEWERREILNREYHIVPWLPLEYTHIIIIERQMITICLFCYISCTASYLISMENGLRDKIFAHVSVPSHVFPHPYHLSFLGPVFLSIIISLFL